MHALYDDADDLAVVVDSLEHEESDRGEGRPGSGVGGRLLTRLKRMGTVNFNLAATRSDGSPSTS